MFTLQRLLAVTVPMARALKPLAGTVRAATSCAKVGENACFGGKWQRFTHESAATGTPMTFSVFTPPDPKDAPCLFWLSGLTCDDQNFVTKAGAARAAAAHGIAIVAPDTSPRLPEDARLEGEDDAYDFGSGAGFYVDATEEPWSAHYKMLTYVTEELPAAVAAACPELDVVTKSISGHSMGGHGALTLAMRSPYDYTSVSAFSPICNPTKCPWGVKAFEGYLGSVQAGAAHDAVELVKGGAPFPFGEILVSQGADDDFLVGDVDQLQPEAFRSACDAAGQPLDLRYEAGYDHSYFFISSFIDEHVDFHAKALLAAKGGATVTTLEEAMAAAGMQLKPAGE